MLFFMCLNAFQSVNGQTQKQRAGNSIHLASPDGDIKCIIQSKGADIGYSVTYNGKSIISFSKIGLNSQDLILKKAVYSKVNNTIPLILADNASYTEVYNQLELKGEAVDLFFRVYNDGISFRLVDHHKPVYHPFEVNFSDRTSKVYQQGISGTEDKWRFMNGAENLYKKVTIADMKGTAEFPLLIEGKGWAGLLHEAGNTGFPPSIIVKGTKGNLESKEIYQQSPLMASPWHYILLAKDANRIVEKSDLIYSLNRPSQIKDVSWIRPGKAFRDVALTTKSATEAIDFCKKMNFQYLLFDAGWYGLGYGMDKEHDPASNAMKVVDGLDIKKVTHYATENKIGVILYVNLVALRRQLDTVLPLYKSWGIKGIKFGFVDGRTAEGISFVQEAVEKAAKYGFVVDVHDNYRPTGLSRTLPNLLTQEGVRGGEHMPDADHNTILPYARFTIGAADYTMIYKGQNEMDTTHFTNASQLYKLRNLPNTQAHQLALSVVYFSPLQFIFWYGKPEIYDTESVDVEFFKKVPTTWDETRVLNGKIGEFITMARRQNKTWYLGTITNKKARTLKIACHFLPKGKKYLATIYQDNGKGKINKFTQAVTSDSVIEATLLASGGQTAIITPQINHLK
jgi:alpha-glucosidase